MDAAKGDFRQGLIYLFKFILFVLGIVLFYMLVRYISHKYSTRSNTPNIASTQAKQTLELDTRWTGNVRGSVAPVPVTTEGFSQPVQGLESQIGRLPSDQQLLINTSVFSTRLTGFLGPYDSGVFSEDAATRIALSSGSRCLILEIDYLDDTKTPLLVYRDGWGMKQSINTGSIKSVAKSIAARAFTVANDSVSQSVSTDPLFVVLYFVRTPNQGKAPQDYVKYLGAVAEELQPLSDLIVAQTPQGDFRRQALESQLFFNNFSVFKNRIIILTNVDTTPFRQLTALGLGGQIGPKQDLDLMTHVRLYSAESPTSLGASSGPIGSTKPAALITSPNYWLTTPADRLNNAVATTKQAWVLVMQPNSSPTNQPSAKDIDSLLNSYGVHSLPTTLFADPKVTDPFVASGRPYNKGVWSVKPELLLYVPPKPIPIQRPIPQANSGGGMVVAPKL